MAAESNAKPQTPASSTEGTCELCQAPPGVPCVNTVNPGAPIPFRDTHHARNEIQWPKN